MDLSDFDTGAFDVGYSLTIEERAALEVGLARAKAEAKLARCISHRVDNIDTHQATVLLI
jgi:hypothetical protein